MLQGIEIGNKFYDSFSAGNPGIMFGVKDAAQNVQRSVVITSVGPELPADIARQPLATANLPYHIELAINDASYCKSFHHISDDRCFCVNGAEYFTSG